MGTVKSIIKKEIDRIKIFQSFFLAGEEVEFSFEAGFEPPPPLSFDS